MSTASVLDRLPGTGTVRANADSLLVALLAGIAGVAGSYAVAGLTPSFVAGPIAGLMARVTPGPIVQFAIVVLGDLGHQLNLLGALAIAVGLLASVAGLGIAVGRRFGRPLVGAVLGAVGAAVVSFAITFAPVAAAGTAVGVGVVLLAAELLGTRSVGGFSARRRRVLGGAGSALALAGGGFLLGTRGGTHGRTVNADAEGVGNGVGVEMPVSSLLAEADSKSLDVAGLEPLVSDEFYNVDINATDPAIDAEEWTLTVTGDVEQEVEYTYDDIRGMESENRFVSLRCVGEGLNGRKLDNAVWTGVSLPELVEPAGVPENCCVMLRAEDGFFEEFPLSALQDDGFLAFGMNGEVLPRSHGYPARALIPGHWGEINVKWLTEIEILEEPMDGYWEQRGWHGTGPVNTVAKLHVDNRLDDGRIEVAGHAYAGTRGIQRVEVSTDGGDSWNEATLSAELPGTDVWRQWVYRYEPPAESHEVVVRATDGNGDLQPQERAEAFPSGATGWVSKTVRP
jgi:DMSO/TMAO reductase YedYZ molybdopterin-dependent catalytic subunit